MASKSKSCAESSKTKELCPPVLPISDLCNDQVDEVIEKKGVVSLQGKLIDRLEELKSEKEGVVSLQRELIDRLKELDVRTNSDFETSSDESDGQLVYLLSGGSVFGKQLVTKETHNFIDKNFYSKMKKGSLFITTSRGSIHNENDLETFLKNGHLSGAGLDVWEKEPPNSDHKLLKMQNVVATPHMAGVTIDSRKKMSEFVANQLLNILSGGVPERPVNEEILSLFKSKLSKII